MTETPTCGANVVGETWSCAAKWVGPLVEATPYCLYSGDLWERLSEGYWNGTNVILKWKL